jgi:hypothetical protein
LNYVVSRYVSAIFQIVNAHFDQSQLFGADERSDQSRCCLELAERSDQSQRYLVLVVRSDQSRRFSVLCRVAFARSMKNIQKFIFKYN